MREPAGPQPVSSVCLPPLIDDDAQVRGLGSSLRKRVEPGLRRLAGGMRDGDEGYVPVGFGGAPEVEEGFLRKGTAAVAEEDDDCGVGFVLFCYLLSCGQD